MIIGYFLSSKVMIEWTVILLLILKQSTGQLDLHFFLKSTGQLDQSVSDEYPPHF